MDVSKQDTFGANLAGESESWWDIQFRYGGKRVRTPLNIKLES
jgi:hypothetical protein